MEPLLQLKKNIRTEKLVGLLSEIWRNIHNKYISKSERNITEEGLKNSGARLLPKGAVLMTSRAPIGSLAVAGDKICTNQGFKSFIVNEDKIHNEYSYYFLKNNIDRIKSLGTSSTFAEVSALILKNVEIENSRPCHAKRN